MLTSERNMAEGKKWNRKVSLPEPPQTFEMSTQQSQKEQTTSKGEQKSDHSKKMESFGIRKTKVSTFLMFLFFFLRLPFNKGYESEEPSENSKECASSLGFLPDGRSDALLRIPCRNKSDRQALGKDGSDAAWEGFLQGS